MRIYVTIKQKQILDLLREGKSQNEIAKQLNCSPENISQHIMRIQRRYPQLKIWKETKRRVEFDLDGLT